MAEAPADDLSAILAGWHLPPDGDTQERIDALLEPLYARGLLPDGHESVDAVLLGDQYHLGGTDDTRRMARLAGVGPADRVVDLACYIGGPARQLARECGCEVVGVDISEVHVAVGAKLTELAGLAENVTFVCASAEAAPLPDGSLTVAWSQCTMPADLSWLREMDRLLGPGGRLAFTGLIRREACEDGSLLPLDEISERVSGMGYRVISAEDISQMDLDCGWLPALDKLNRDERRYVELVGAEWVGRARASIEGDIAAWRAGRMGNGRVVAVKGGGDARDRR